MHYSVLPHHDYGGYMDEESQSSHTSSTDTWIAHVPYAKLIQNLPYLQVCGLKHG